MPVTIHGSKKQSPVRCPRGRGFDAAIMGLAPDYRKISSGGMSSASTSLQTAQPIRNRRTIRRAILIHDYSAGNPSIGAIGPRPRPAFVHR